MRTDRRTDSSPRTAVVFFSSCKLPKTVTVTTLLLFGAVALWDISLYLDKDLQLSDC